METEAGSPSPSPSRPGAVFPLYHVFADVGAFAGGHVIPSTSSAPLCVTSMVLCRGNRTRILLANMRPEPQRVRLAHPDLGPYVTVKRLDETCVEQAMSSPESFRNKPGDRKLISNDALDVRLMPYALTRIDAEGGS